MPCRYINSSDNHYFLLPVITRRAMMDINEYTFPIGFLLVLTGTEPLRLLKDAYLPDFNPKKWPLISPDGFLNKFLAGHSFEIFTLVFIILQTYKLIVVIKMKPLLPTSDMTQIYDCLQGSKSDVSLIDTMKDSGNKKAATFRYSGVQMIKLAGIFMPVITCIVWFFGPSLYERIHRITGGHCIGHPETVFYRSCVSSGWRYEGGFKSSGHSLITCTFASALSWETVSLNKWIVLMNRITELPVRVSGSCKLLQLAFLALCLAWLMMFTVTCMFYHSFMERVVGTLCALLIVYFVCFRLKL